MFIEMVRSKIHLARVTEANLNYVGSIGIDIALLEKAGMYPYEKVLVANVETGARLETYIIPKLAGSRIISLNGAAARMVSVGDRVIIMTFALVEPPPPADFEPRVLIMNADNGIESVMGPLPEI
jgi:aspartate 1-decarboxylase